MSRGLAGSIERSWSGAPGTVPWTLALYPLALLYAGAAAFARARAGRARLGIPGLPVVAIGGLTAGGSGKSSLAAWLATELHARGEFPAILLRGHRARRPGDAPYVVPDYERYPALTASTRGGDEAAAHRGALPPEIPVAVHWDRHASAKQVRAGYGATVAILDDGWEQSTLRWDELWAVLDPDLPAGNGAPIPAGPLRRPLSSIGEASVIAVIEDDTTAGGKLDWIHARAGAVPVVRFRRVLASVTPLGARRGRGPAEGARSGNGVARLPPAGLVSGIGAPERLERFARGAGIDVVAHAAFPDHASWTAGEIEAAVDSAVRRGARAVLTTEKDEARWPRSARAAVPVLVLRTALEPLDPVESILARVCGLGGAPADRVASTAP